MAIGPPSMTMDSGTFSAARDDTIKVAGKRLGPAEVESVLVAHPAVSEAAAIGVPDAVKGEAMVCFCVLKEAELPRRTNRCAGR